jgi:predicted metal-dependent peptidase
MGQLEYDAGMSELLDILQTCRPERVHVLSCDAKVHTHTELADANELLANAPEMKGGGGTAFEPVFQWVEAHRIEPCVLIYFTDLMGSFPREAPPYPVVWVSTHPGEAPFGETIIIDLSDEQS